LISDSVPCGAFIRLKSGRIPSDKQLAVTRAPLVDPLLEGVSSLCKKIPDGEEIDLLDLDFALDRLSQQAPRKARLIELFYIGGLKCEEAAVVLDVSTSTVNRDLKLAKAWLRRELRSMSSNKP